MRVMLVGTSNSIFKDGYRAEFESNSAVTRFKYHGMGASSSIILPYFLANEDLAEFDFLVIETSINDVLQYTKGVLSADQIRDNLRWACARAVSAGCKPVVMIMPTLGGVRKRNIADVIHRQVAAEFQAGYIDGYDFVRTATLFKPQKPAGFFKDQSHLKPAIGRIVGKLAIAKMKSLDGTTLPPVPLGHDFRTILAGDLTDQPLVRTNSLMTISSHVLGEGDTLTVDIGAGNTLSGLAMNRVESWGFLNLRGKTSATMPLTTRYSKLAVSFLAGVKAVPALLPDAEGRITLSISATPQFGTLVSVPQSSNSAGPAGAQVELMGLVLRRDL
ncbi:MAG: hypothetical protein JNJ84_06860 [Rhodobacteraceae bacterium]|nr:hypothetical protein [Paracoccaceae bacterium]